MCLFSFSAYIPLNNYLVFNDVDGLYTYTFEAERKVMMIFSIFFFICYTSYKCSFKVSLQRFSFLKVKDVKWSQLLPVMIDRTTVQHVVRFLKNYSSHHLQNCKRCWSIWLRMLLCKYTIPINSLSLQMIHKYWSTWI